MISTKKMIYVIDDDALYIYGVKRLLSKSLPETDLCTFSNGEEAITELLDRVDRKQSLPDVILLDLNMPRMNGWEFLRNFEAIKKEAQQEVQVFVITSQADSETMRLNQIKWDESVNEFIQKPVKADAILKLLQ